MDSYKKEEIYYTVCPVGNATYIALNKGFLAEGLGTLGVVPTKLQSLPLNRWVEHYTYNNDKLFREGGNTPPLWAYAKGAEVSLIGLNLLGERQVFLVRKDSGIDSLAQIKGKRFALPVHPNAVIDYHKASAEQAYEELFRIANVSPAEVEFVEVFSDKNYCSSEKEREDKIGEVRAELIALDEGKLDIIFMKLSTIQVLLDTGKYKILYDLSEDRKKFPPVNNEYPNTLTVSRRLAEKRPEVVVEFVKQTLLAAEWAKQNRDEAETLLAKQTFGDLRQYRCSYHSDFYQKLAPNFSDESLTALENRAKFLFDHGYLAKPVDVYQWADDYFLQTALKELGKAT